MEVIGIGPPKHLNLAIFLSFHSCIFIFFCHFLWKLLNFLRFAQIVSRFHNFSKFLFVCFTKLFFFKAARMLSLFQGPPDISWHRAPKKLDTALPSTSSALNFSILQSIMLLTYLSTSKISSSENALLTTRDFADLCSTALTILKLFLLFRPMGMQFLTIYLLSREFGPTYYIVKGWKYWEGGMFHNILTWRQEWQRRRLLRLYLDVSTNDTANGTRLSVTARRTLGAINFKCKCFKSVRLRKSCIGCCLIE